MTLRRAGIYLGVVLVITADTFRHMFGDSRPIDIAMLVIEVLVLALIAVEGIVNLVRWRSRRSITLRLRSFLAEGQKLLDNPPPPQALEQEARVWEADVQDWTKAVHSFLDEKAKSAVTVFDHAPLGSQELFTHVSRRIEHPHLKLGGQLQTLLSIMEKPDVYF
jgi:hypothetical protein